MKKSFYALVALLVLSACSRDTKVTITDASTMIEVEQSGIVGAADLPWSVGRPQRGAKVSKGIRLEVAMPDLSESELLEMHETFGLDSWVAKINRVQNGNRELLGYFYVPLIYQRESSISARSVSTGVIQILYSAAAPSKRFGEFPCPAFGHNLKVGDTSLSDGDKATLTATKGRKSPLSAKLEKLEFGAVAYNGGKSLTGIYWVELALFDSSTNQMLSDFNRLGGVLQIHSEDSIAIKGCSDFVIPKRDEGQGIQDFKFGN